MNEQSHSPNCKQEKDLVVNGKNACGSPITPVYAHHLAK